MRLKHRARIHHEAHVRAQTLADEVLVQGAHRKKHGHGHAVAAGLAVMARASERLGWAEPGVSARIAACLEKNGLPTGTDYPAEALAKAALADKKRSGDSITIVVPKAIGDCELKRIPVTELLPIIAAGRGE